MPIEYQDEISVVVNLAAAARMGVDIPADLLAQAARVID